MLTTAAFFALALAQTSKTSKKPPKLTPEQAVAEARKTLGPNSEAWTLVAAGETMIQFIKTADLINAAERKQSFRSVWIVSIHDAGEAVGSSVALREFACESTDHQYRTKSVTQYRNRDRTDPLPSEDMGEHWEFAVPDTVGDAVFQAVCSDDASQWRPAPPPTADSIAAGPKTLQAYRDGKMDPDTRAEFERLVSVGALLVPADFELSAPRPKRYVDCAVDWKRSGGEQASADDLKKYNYRVVILDDGITATVARCGESLIYKQYTCDSYNADRISYDEHVRIAKYYFFNSQFDVQVFPGGRLLENNGRGSIAWATCSERFSDAVKAVTPAVKDNRAVSGR